LELDGTSRNTERRGVEHIRRGQQLDWVVEVKFLHGRSGSDSLLCLGDDHILWHGRQGCAFIGVQINILRMDFIIIVHWGIPRDAQFNIVILERDQWDRRLPVFTEGESEWVKSRRRRIRTIWTLTCVLCENGRRDILREMRRLIIDDLSANQEFDLLNSARPLRFRIRTWTATRDVAIPEEITLTLESNGRDTTCGWDALEHLAFHGLGKVCVTTIVRSEETDFGLADEMGILSTDGDELGNTTRHFIYSEVIFLTGSSLHDG